MPNEKYNTGSSASTSVIIKVAGIDRVFFFFLLLFFFSPIGCENQCEIISDFL